MTSLIAPWPSTPLSGMATSSRPASTSSRPPQKGRLRRQPRQRSRLVMALAAPAEADGQAGQGERARRGQPCVLDQVVDRDRVGLLAESAGLACRPRVLAERPGVLADGDVAEDRLAAGLPARVDDQVVRG